VGELEGLLSCAIGASGAVLIVQLYRHLRKSDKTTARQTIRANLIPATIAVICGIAIAQLIALLPPPYGVGVPEHAEGQLSRISYRGPPLSEELKHLLIAGIGAFCVWVLLSRRD
jgi:hypothetical protein